MGENEFLDVTSLRPVLSGINLLRVWSLFSLTGNRDSSHLQLVSPSIKLSKHFPIHRFQSVSRHMSFNLKLSLV